MTYSALTTLNMGDIVHTIFDNEIYNQLSEDYEEFKMIESMKVSDSLGRTHNLYLQKSLGPGSVQYRNPGTTNRAFPSSHQASAQEVTVQLKELNTTIEFEQNLYYRAKETPEKYADRLEIEVSGKAIVTKRRIAADLYGDGSGVIGSINTVSVNSAVANRAVVTLQAGNTARGHAGMFEIDEKLIDKTNAGAAGASPTISAGTFSYWIVTDRDRAAGTVTLAPVNTLGNTVNVSAWSPASTDLLYKNEQPTFPDVSGSITDYGTLSEAMVGLESWTNDDSRVVFGATMTGAIKGSRYSAAANAIDAKHFQKALDNVKVNVGQGRYSYKMAISSPETNAALLESAETDRRFKAEDSASRGFSGKMTFKHGNDSVALTTSEYCPQKRIYLLPESKSGRKAVLGYIGTGVEAIKLPGMDSDGFFLKATSSGYVNMVQSFLQAYGQMVCRHPAAIGVIHNFTNS